MPPKMVASPFEKGRAQKEVRTMKDMKKVSIYRDGKLVEKAKVDYQQIDEFCRNYRNTHEGEFSFKVELYRFRG